MVKLVESMTADHPARPVLVASNDPAASGLARAQAFGGPVAAVDHRAYKGDRPAFEAALQAELDKAEGVIACEYCGRYLLPFMYDWGTR
jgi:phosphoribosylglycinamide formyltransferase-1